MGVCDVPVISSVCDSAGEAAANLVTAPFDWLAEAMGNAAKWMFESVWQVFDSTTFVDVSGSEFTKVYNILFGVAVFVMLGFFMLQVIGGMVRREPAALTRAALGLAKSVLGSFVALTLLAAALEITDQLCIGIVHAAGTNMEEMGDRIALLPAGLTGLSIAAPGAGAIVTIFIAGLAIGAAVLVWISLLVRKALLLIAIVFAPIAFAGSSWDHTRTWVGKWASVVVALIASKVVIVVIFLLATAQVSAPIDADLQSVSQPIAGVVLMLIAGFAPYLSYKAISFMGFDMYHAMSAEQEAKSALNRPLPIPVGGRGGRQPRQVLEAAAGAGGGGSGGREAAPAANASGGGGTSVATASGGATGGAAAAGAGVAAAAMTAREAGTAGPKLGGYVGTVASQQSNGTSESQADPSLPLPQVADPALASAGTRNKG
jgi:type IV secretion system protein TrbL